jgi:hypothetical protein
LSYANETPSVAGIVELLRATLTDDADGVAWRHAYQELCLGRVTADAFEQVIAETVAHDSTLACRALLFYADWLSEDALPVVQRLAGTYPALCSGDDWPQLWQTLDDHGVVHLD